MSEILSLSMFDLVREIERQDEGHPSGYPATRDGVFLGITTGIHELEVEALDRWRNERCKCDTPACTHPSWEQTRDELVQAAAVIMRTVRSIDSNREIEDPRFSVWYEILDDGGAIRCKCCNRASHNPNDVKMRYCGYCHVFHAFHNLGCTRPDGLRPRTIAAGESS